PACITTFAPVKECTRGKFSSSSFSPGSNRLYSFTIRPGLYRPAGKVAAPGTADVKLRGANAARAGAAAARCKKALRFISAPIANAVGLRFFVQQFANA